MFKNEEIEEANYELMNMLDFQDAIILLYALRPTDKRKKESKSFYENYNKLVDLYNKRIKTKIFTKI